MLLHGNRAYLIPTGLLMKGDNTTNPEIALSGRDHLCNEDFAIVISTGAACKPRMPSYSEISHTTPQPIRLCDEVTELTNW